MNRSRGGGALAPRDARRDGASRSVDVLLIESCDGRHTNFQGAGYPSKTLRENPERQKDALNDWIFLNPEAPMSKKLKFQPWMAFVAAMSILIAVGIMTS